MFSVISLCNIFLTQGLCVFMVILSASIYRPQHAACVFLARCVWHLLFKVNIIPLTKFSALALMPAHLCRHLCLFVTDCVFTCNWERLWHWSMYLVLWVGVGDSEHGHGSRHGLHGCEDVLKDAFGEGFPLLLWEASSVDDPHLSDEGGFPALPSTWGNNREK